jgi:hypothetical protein
MLMFELTARKPTLRLSSRNRVLLDQLTLPHLSKTFLHFMEYKYP